MQTQQRASLSQPLTVHPASTTQTSDNSIPAPKDNATKDIELPKELEAVPTVTHFPSERHSWNTNEEIAAILLAFSEHHGWQSNDVKVWPSSGTMVLYSRKKVRYRRDGFCWKKRRDGKTTREDHMKLKVQGVECIYGCYVHSAILQTFHRRCYWLLQNPDIVLVHYLNVPLAEDSKLSVPTLSLCPQKEWTQQELIAQLQPMFASMQQSDPSNVTEQLIEDMIRSIVNKLMISQNKSTGRTHHDCTCVNAPNCSHMGRRIISPKLASDEGKKTSQWLHKHLVSMLHDDTPGVGHDHTASVLLNAARQLGDGQTDAISHTPVFLNLSQLASRNNLIILNSQQSAAVPLMKTSGASCMPPPVHPVGKTCSTSCMPLPARPPGTLVNPLLQGATVLAPRHMSQPVDDPKAGSADSSYDTTVGSRSLIKPEPSDKANFSAAAPSPLVTDWSSHGNECEEVTVHCVDTAMDERATNEAKSEPATPTATHAFKECTFTCPDMIGDVASVHLSANATIPPSSNAYFSVDEFDLANFTSVDEQLKWGLELNPEREAGTHGQLGIHSGLSGLRHQAIPSPDSMMFLGQPGCHIQDDLSKKKSDDVVKLTITDFSPEWSYPEGGTKVLVTGPWSSFSSTYTILLDGVSVPATLVQAGVLRCFTRAHAVGLLTLEVACDGHVISNLVVFEYKARETSPPAPSNKLTDWFGVSESQLKVAVMEKLEELKKRLSPDITHFVSSQAGGLMIGHDAFETHVVEYCSQLSKRSWCHGDEPLKACSGPRRLTLLHLAAALGCAKLIATLVKWRQLNGSAVLDHDVNPVGLDNNGCTPLMWACVGGRTEAAMVLLGVYPGALQVCNIDGATSLHLAEQRGHFALVQHIASLQMAAQVINDAVPPAGCKIATNDRLFSDIAANVHTRDGVLNFVNSPPPVASSTPRLMRENLESSHDVLTRPTGVATFSHRGHIADNEQLSIEIPTPLMLTEQASHRGSSLPRCLHASPRAGSSRDGTSVQRHFMKRTSVDVLPDYARLHSGGDLASVASPAGMRSVNSDPYLARDPDPMISVSGRDVYSPDVFMQPDYHSSYNDAFSLDLHHHIAMDTEDVSSDSNLPKEMVTLANEIIAGMPERIKSCLPPDVPSGGDISGLLTAAETTVNSCRDRSSSYSSFSSSCSSCHTPPGVSAGVVAADDSGISTPPEGLSFDEYRCSYPELGTPESSVSPASSCLPSPYSFRLDSPAPTAADFTEYFNAPTTYMQKDFSQLTLSDDEQRKLYAAAQLIQCYYRRYLDKKEYLQKQRELEAAILIQSYYRRYKQYMYYKKMTQAAVLIQSQFRSYTAQKRFKLSRDAATVIQSRYRAYREHKGYKRRRTAAVIIQQRFRSHYQRKRVNQQESAGKLRKRLQQTEMGAETSGIIEPATVPHTSDDHDSIGHNIVTAVKSEGSRDDT